MFGCKNLGDDSCAFIRLECLDPGGWQLWIGVLGFKNWRDDGNWSMGRLECLDVRIGEMTAIGS